MNVTINHNIHSTWNKAKLLFTVLTFSFTPQMGFFVHICQFAQSQLSLKKLYEQFDVSYYHPLNGYPFPDQRLLLSYCVEDSMSKEVV